jgi:glycerol uptake facilitator-like aquaporin
MSLAKRTAAEFIDTFWLVFGGCGSAVLAAALVAEVVLTFMFLIIILGSTDARAPAGFAPIAIGLGLTLIHLIGVPVKGNP